MKKIIFVLCMSGWVDQILASDFVPPQVSPLNLAQLTQTSATSSDRGIKKNFVRRFSSGYSLPQRLQRNKIFQDCQGCQNLIVTEEMISRLILSVQRYAEVSRMQADAIAQQEQRLQSQQKLLTYYQNKYRKLSIEKDFLEPKTARHAQAK